MDRYITQITEDLAKAEANPTPETDFGTSYEDFEKQMLEFEEGETVSAKDMLNVSFEELPPVEMLNKVQIKKLLISIFNALSAKGTNVHVPGSDAPVEVVYEAIREMFKDGFRAMPGWNIDFCSGWCPECKFADYCESCGKTWTKEDLEKERKNS